METLSGRSWKDYYAHERKVKSKIIDREILRWWETDDQEVGSIIRKGGAVSFPHTYLAHSLTPVVRTVSSILKTGMERTIALGVLHSLNYSDPGQEFSLDNFRYVMKRSCELLDIPGHELEEAYFPKGSVDKGDARGTVESIIRDTDNIIGHRGKDTSLVMTGDLVHYGKYYGNTVDLEDLRTGLRVIVEEGLDILYKKKDQAAYFHHALSHLNDQWAPAIAVDHLLGRALDHSIFSFDITDYSKVLETPPPCLVVSVLYGVHPRD